MTVRTKLATFAAVLALTFGVAYGAGTTVHLDEADPPVTPGHDDMPTGQPTDTTSTTHDGHATDPTQGQEG